MLFAHFNKICAKKYYICMKIKYSMTEARKKQEKRRKVINAKKERIENTEVAPAKKRRTTKIKDEDITLSVPFDVATRMNQNLNLRGAQNNLRKQLSVFIESNFNEFLSDYKELKSEPALRARLFVEVMKIVIPRPKDFGDDADSKEQRDKMISRLFGKQE